MSETESNLYTPPLGDHHLTSDYDKVIEVMTRERRWRKRILNALRLNPGNRVVDIGSGTGTLAVAIKIALPEVEVIGIEPDEAAIKIARSKSESHGVCVHFVKSLGENYVTDIKHGSVNCVISSLVLHQCSHDAKIGILTNAFRYLCKSGQLIICDYGVQKTLLMQLLFRQVRLLDGFENTRSNKNGEIPCLIHNAGFRDVTHLSDTLSPTGSISLISATRP